MNAESIIFNANSIILNAESIVLNTKSIISNNDTGFIISNTNFMISHRHQPRFCHSQVLTLISHALHRMQGRALSLTLCLSAPLTCLHHTLLEMSYSRPQLRLL